MNATDMLVANPATPGINVDTPKWRPVQLLSSEQLDGMFDRLATPEMGRIRIRRIRDELPSRVTRSNKVSGKLRYPSLKMGFVLEAEAWKTEFLALVEWDYDQETLEIYPQPEKLKIRYTSADGKRPIVVHTTPDAFRITQECFSFVECKTEEFLLDESKKNPSRYVRQDDGRWRSPPGEVAAAALGCRFEVRSTSENNYVLHENLELLKDFYWKKPPPAPSEAVQLLNERMDGKAFISAFDLIHIAPSISADHLYTLLVFGIVYFPLHALRLVDQETALFFRDELSWNAHSIYCQVDTGCRVPCYRTELKAGDTFAWNGVNYEVINPGTDKLSARSLDSKTSLIHLTYDEIARIGNGILFNQDPSNVISNIAAEKLRAASPSDIQEAVWRFEILFGTPSPGNMLINRKERVRFDWISSYRHAENAWGNGFVGLLSRRHGNRQAKVSNDTKLLAIETQWRPTGFIAESVGWGWWVMFLPAPSH